MWPEFVLFALICFLSIAINMPDSKIAHLGLDSNYLFAALAAIVIAGLSEHRNVVGYPDSGQDGGGEAAAILFATLIALNVVPFLAGKIDFR